jgi:hypothetical protein
MCARSAAVLAPLRMDGASFGQTDVRGALWHRGLCFLDPKSGQRPEFASAGRRWCPRGRPDVLSHYE